MRRSAEWKKRSPLNPFNRSSLPPQATHDKRTVTMAATQHFLDLGQFTAEELRKILDLAHALKAKLKEGEKPALLKDKVLAMIFDRESTRTPRVI